MQTKFKSGYGDNLFKKNLPAGDVYVGVSFNDYFGVNVGYYSSTKKSRDATLTGGDVAVGRPPLPIGISAANYESTIKISGPFIDLVGIVPTGYWNTNLFASVGLEKVKTTLRRTHVSLSTPARTISVNDTAAFSKNKIILRFQVGASKNIFENFKILALIGWKNTSKMNLDSTSSPQNWFVKAKLKNTFNYGLGLQYSFF